MSVARLVRIGMLTAVFTLTFTSSRSPLMNRLMRQIRLANSFKSVPDRLPRKRLSGCKSANVLRYLHMQLKKHVLYQHVLLTQYVVPRAVIVNAETHWKCYRLSQQATLATLSAIDRGSLLGVDAGAAVIDLYVAHIAELRQL